MVRSFVCAFGRVELLPSIHSVPFGQLLPCAHQRIANNNESVYRKQQHPSGVNTIP